VNYLRKETNRDTIRYTEANLLKIMNQCSIKQELNRNCTKEWEELLDENGIHILTLSFHHHYAGGKPVNFHYRTFWLCKMKDTNVPAEVTLDISPEHYDNFVFSKGVEDFNVKCK
jgi:hypothetical protein